MGDQIADDAATAASPWIEAVNEDGHVYWYNVETQMSTWDNPFVDETVADELESDSLSVFGQFDAHDVSRARGLSDSISGETEFLVDSGTFSAFVTQPVRRRGSVKAPSDGVPVDDSAGCTSVHSVQNGVHSGGADVGSMSSHSESAIPENANERRTRMSLTTDPWVECREVVSGRTLFYHRVTKEVVFDVSPSAIDSAAIKTANAIDDAAIESGSGAFPSYFRPAVPSSVPPSDAPVSSNAASVPHKYGPSSMMTMKGDVFNEPVGSYTPLIPDALSQLHSIPIVGELLETQSLPWNFSNPMAQHYRAVALAHPLNEHVPPPQAMMYPRYFSTIPIPAQRHIVCTVKLPESGVKSSMSYTKIHCSATDSANDMVWKALKKCDGRNFEPEKCILKAIGTEEYIYGTASVLDFEYIRARVESVNDEMRVDEESDRYPADDAFDQVAIYNDGDYQEACNTDAVPVERLRVLPIKALTIPLRFQVCDLENIQLCPRFEPLIYAVCVEIKLMLGSVTLPNTTVRTRFRRPREGLLFLQDITLPNIDLSTLPSGTVIVFAAYGVRLEQKEVLLSYVKQPVVEFNGCLVAGRKCLPMWIVPNDDKGALDDINFARATCRPNLSVVDAPTLNVRFDSYLCPVLCPVAQPPIPLDTQLGGPVSLNTMNAKIRNRLEGIVSRDALYEFDSEEKEILWMARYNYMNDASVLPKLMRCVDWLSPQQAAEAYHLLYAWAKPEHPLHALALLDVHYADYRVREYAVSILEELSDSDLQQVLLQLVQVLKFELNHDSPLARFLLRRGIKNPYQIGHFLFWHLKAEIHNPDVCERFALLLENYLVNIKRHARELLSQDYVIKQLQAVAEQVQFQKTKELMADVECKELLRENLGKLNRLFPERWQIPLNPKWQVRALKPQFCKYMSSKKVPLWLCFANSDPDGGDIRVIFKTGDDLRQDLLTLQLFRIMDRTWLRQGKDMALKPYTCVATGVTRENEGVGMIEVVGDSATISDIQIEEGGGALGAFKNKTLVKWLQKHNRGTPEFNAAVDNFMRSCAGYCVATFCLGIGDRHNDNIMLTKDGHLFHIDFGHFLGNFKSKYGFKRERFPFVFTPEMAQVMGGLKSHEYKEFVALCCSAFNILRKEASLFLNLFSLMIPAGMPELSCTEDIHYLRDQLLLTLSDDAASKAFKKEIKKTISDFYRRVDNSIHILVKH